jgi:hypothetical protein
MNDTPNRFGEAGNEARAGYQPIAPRATVRPQRPQHEFNDSDRNAARQAASELIAKRQRTERRPPAEAQPVRYADKDGRTLPGDVTVPFTRAVEDRSDYMFAANVGMDIHNRDKLAHDVDKARAEAGVPTDPTHRDKNLVNPAVFGDPRSHMPAQIDPAHHLPENRTPPAPPGIDPELHRAMQNPQVRAELEAQFGDVAKQVQVANDFARGAFYSVFPETKKFSAAEMTQYLTGLAKINPQKFKQAQALLDNVAKAENGRQLVERHRTQREQQQFQRYGAEQDLAFDRMVSHRNYTPEQRRAMGQEAVAYAQEMGIDQRTLANLARTNPVFRHAAFQKMIHDAVVGRMAQKSLEALRQQQRAANIPPVARPGSGAPRTNPQSANLQALNAKLSKTADVKDAAALLIASRNAKRRR